MEALIIQMNKWRKIEQDKYATPQDAPKLDGMETVKELRAILRQLEGEKKTVQSKVAGGKKELTDIEEFVE